MKKALFSLATLLASGMYILSQYTGNTLTYVANTQPVVQQTAPVSSSVSQPVAQATPPPQTNPTPKISPTPAPTPAPTPTPKPLGQYADGTYTGTPADAYYGTVQIQAVVQNGKLASVTFLQYPNDRSTSRYINSQAMPILKSEAIQTQSANVDIVSGATDTSGAFRQSLGSALAQAKN